MNNIWADFVIEKHIRMLVISFNFSFEEKIQGTLHCKSTLAWVSGGQIQGETVEIQI